VGKETSSRCSMVKKEGAVPPENGANAALEKKRFEIGCADREKRVGQGTRSLQRSVNRMMVHKKRASLALKSARNPHRRSKLKARIIRAVKQRRGWGRKEFIYDYFRGQKKGGPFAP